MLSTAPTSFLDLGVHPAICVRLELTGATRPFDVQTLTLPEALPPKSRNVLALAWPGYGKTFAALPPIIQTILTSPKQSSPLAVIAAPDLGLARQLFQVCQNFRSLDGTEIRMSLIVEVDNQRITRSELKRNPQLVVGTPIALLEAIQHGELDISSIKVFYLDEAHRMSEERARVTDLSALDRALWDASVSSDRVAALLKKADRDLLRSMSVVEQFDELVVHVPPDCQRILSTATAKDAHAVRFAELLPGGFVANAALGTPLKHLNHSICLVPGDQILDKLPKLVRSMQPHGACIILVEPTNALMPSPESIIAELGNHGILACRVGGRSERIVEVSIGNPPPVLVCYGTEVTGRDFNGMVTAINVGVPAGRSRYIDQSGRAGRAGREGFAVTVDDPDAQFGAESILLSMGLTFSHRTTEGTLCEAVPSEDTLLSADEVRSRVEAALGFRFEKSPALALTIAGLNNFPEDCSVRGSLLAAVGYELLPVALADLLAAGHTLENPLNDNRSAQMKLLLSSDVIGDVAMALDLPTSRNRDRTPVASSAAEVRIKANTSFLTAIGAVWFESQDLKAVAAVVAKAFEIRLQPIGYVAPLQILRRNVDPRALQDLQANARVKFNNPDWLEVYFGPIAIRRDTIPVREESLDIGRFVLRAVVADLVRRSTLEKDTRKISAEVDRILDNTDWLNRQMLFDVGNVLWRDFYWSASFRDRASGAQVITTLVAALYTDQGFRACYDFIARTLAGLTGQVKAVEATRGSTLDAAALQEMMDELGERRRAREEAQARQSQLREARRSRPDPEQEYVTILAGQLAGYSSADKLTHRVAKEGGKFVVTLYHRKKQIIQCREVSHGNAWQAAIAQARAWFADNDVKTSEQ